MTLARPDLKIFGSPHRYFQGPGALDLLPEICDLAGGTPALVVDADVLDMTRGNLTSLFDEKPHCLLPFSGEVTFAALDGLARQACEAGSGVIVGMGGGKALDAAKGCAVRTGLRFVAVPTIASNDSPVATGLAVYDGAHRLVALESLGRNPEAVVVDTSLIARAPRKFLLAGIGDALAKKFEGEASAAVGGLNAHYARQTQAARYIADGCYRTIREHAVEALAAAGTGQPNEAFEAVVEANILLAGLAFENMGLSTAHSLPRALGRIPGADRVAHGLHVAYGVLVQLAAEGRDAAFLGDLMAFYAAIGLPRSLTAMGLERIEPDLLHEIAVNAAVAPDGAYLVVPYSTDELIAAMNRIEELHAGSVVEGQHARSRVRKIRTLDVPLSSWSIT